MKLNIKADDALLSVAKRLSGYLDFELSDEGINVEFSEGERVGVSLSGGEARIYYKSKHHIWRELGILIEKLREGKDAIDISEDTHFETVSAMIDSSRCAVPTVKTVKSLIDRFALMGYSMMMLYTEDTVKLDNRPFFGYMRGGYTHDEIREIDDYAYDYGIELVPCIECYAHMERYLIWPEAASVKDTSTVLMAREPKTFELLDDLIGTVSSLFRTRKVHIGMDEAHDMGRGIFLDKNGYVPAFDLFNEYMSELMKIINKYGLSPMMWSDMYFRVHSRTGQLYYDRDTEIPKSTIDKIPENMQLVFWYYGEDSDDCEDYMLKKHNALGREVMFAGGAWSWSGHFPEYNLMMLSNKRSIKACRENGVHRAMLTIWGNDNAECDFFSNLISLSYFAELCYSPDASDEEIKRRFEFTTGADYSLFYKMCYYHSDFENNNNYKWYGERFFGKSLFWQDILEGIYDKALWDKPMSEHYRLAASELAGEHSGEWAYLYSMAHSIMEYLEKKTYIAERLVPIYKSGDRDALADMARVHLPTLRELCDTVHLLHKNAWHKNNKVFGWQNLGIRYAGMKDRIDLAIEYIEDYLAGKIESIDELEVERLPLGFNAYITYQKATTVNWK